MPGPSRTDAGDEAARRAGVIAAAEAWFEHQGLPYFVAANARRVHTALGRRRVFSVVVLGCLVGAAAGVAVGFAGGGVSGGIVVAALVLVIVVAAYGLASLHAGPILRWATRQTFGSLNWFFPLITRALPLLLLFITFLFINTEVWQVASALDRGLLWLTVLLFAGIAVVFLLVRLPEEVRQVSSDVSGERLVGITAHTPVAPVAHEVTVGADDVRLSPLQHANLVLVLLFSQVLQVLLLSVAVFAFFLVFGKVAITDSVIESWIGHPPTRMPSLHWLPVSNQLFQVSVFLAAFSGLYFTVYAVTDQNYREQFFTSIAADLERAVGVQTVYRALHD